MAAEQEALRLDLEELKHLESVAKRPRVLSLITTEIRNLDAKLSNAAAAAPAPASAPPAPIYVEKAPAVAAVLNYVTLSSFSWDQDNDKIKIYVFLDGVEEEKVETVFKPMSVDIKFHDLQGKNYRCAIPKLNKEILPDKSKLLVKPNKVVITLFKASKGNWLDLHFKEDKMVREQWPETQDEDLPQVISHIDQFDVTVGARIMGHAFPPRVNNYYCRGLRPQGEGVLKNTPGFSRKSSSFKVAQLLSQLQRQAMEHQRQMERQEAEMIQAEIKRDEQIQAEIRRSDEQTRALVATQQAQMSSLHAGFSAHLQAHMSSWYAAFSAHLQTRMSSWHAAFSAHLQTQGLPPLPPMPPIQLSFDTP